MTSGWGLGGEGGFHGVLQRNIMLLQSTSHPQTCTAHCTSRSLRFETFRAAASSHSHHLASGSVQKTKPNNQQENQLVSPAHMGPRCTSPAPIVPHRDPHRAQRQSKVSSEVQASTFKAARLQNHESRLRTLAAAFHLVSGTLLAVFPALDHRIRPFFTEML